MNNNFPYSFKHLETSLIAFVADLEAKIQRVFPQMPILMYNVDDSYILIKKYNKTEIQELYNVVPRVTLDVQDIGAKMDENGSQYIRMNYIYKDEIYNTQFRQVVTGMTLNINLVSSNFLKMLQYWEFLVTLFCIDNVFTYEYMGNIYGGRYIMTNSPENEKPPLNNASSDAKNYITKLVVELTISPSFVRIETIQKTSNRSNFIVDTNILVDANGDPIGHSTDLDENRNRIIVNSNPNSQQEMTDIGLTDSQEKKLLKDRRFLKTAANKFNIDTHTVTNEDEVYKSSIIVDTNNQSE